MDAKQQPEKRRVGRFLLTTELLRVGDKQLLRQIFDQVVIWEAKAHALPYTYLDQIEYTAESELFDLVDAGETIPTYCFKFERNKDGEVVMLPIERVN